MNFDLAHVARHDCATDDDVLVFELFVVEERQQAGESRRIVVAVVLARGGRGYHNHDHVGEGHCFILIGGGPKVTAQAQHLIDARLRRVERFVVDGISLSAQVVAVVESKERWW